MKSFHFHAGVLALFYLVSPASAQDPAGADPKKHEIHPHLVGHEDEELLRRIEGALAEWDPRNLTSPYLKKIGTGETIAAGASPAGKRPKYALRRPDLSEFIADPDAAVALGKALFWDMQAGSDFKRKAETTPAMGTACASCHYRFGADARDKHTYSVAYQTWRQFTVDRTPAGQTAPPPELSRPGDRPAYKPSFTQRFFDFTPETKLDFSWFTDPVGAPSPIRPGLRQHEIVGSQGITLKRFLGVTTAQNKTASTEIPGKILFPNGANGFQRRVDMFRSGDNRTRQVTQRNSPSVINAVFNDRQFHDGRAESTFNGFSVFGDYDTDAVLKKAHRDKDGNWTTTTLPVRIGIPNASLASQAVGPIVNEVEMSYLGRTFHDLALKLLDANLLAAQTFPDDDSELSYLKQHALTSYKELIKRAFREEWWREEAIVTDFPLFARLQGGLRSSEATTAFAKAMKDRNGTLMINNFSLYWGLSVMLYQSTLISNESAFDKMMRGDESGVAAKWAEVADNSVELPKEPPLDGKGFTTAGKRPDDIVRKIQLDRLPQLAHPPTLTPAATFQRGFRVFVRNCAECHEPPTFTTAGEIDLGPDIPEPIAKLHAHALVRTALADAFKDRLMARGSPPPAGVTDANRNILGGRRFFPDDQRLDELEALGGPLMIENMGVPANRPTSLFGGNGDRVPMITWLGTRPPLGFTPTPGRRAIDPYAFYDLSFYNLGVSEPRYDWGIWGFYGADEALTREIALRFAVARYGLSPDVTDQLRKIPLGTFKLADIKELKIRQTVEEKMAQDGVNEQGITNTLNEIDELQADLQVRGSIDEASGLASLGSAYRMPKGSRRGTTPPPAIPPNFDEKLLKLFRLNSKNAPVRSADHSAERNYLDYSPRDPDGPATQRSDYHFFKRARRMVMTDEPWGHRKHFITDNELMGWGAFKTPSLRNVALTEPYMHNGRFLTLRQVLAFYSFDNPDLIPAERRLNPDLHPEMGRLDLNSDGLLTGPDGKPGGPLNLPQVHDAEALLFFLHCLTDERVAKEKAPFDHPSIQIVNGYRDNAKPEDSEDIITINAVGPAGHLEEKKYPPQFPSSTDF